LTSVRMKGGLWGNFTPRPESHPYVGPREKAVLNFINGNSGRGKSHAGTRKKSRRPKKKKRDH